MSPKPKRREPDDLSVVVNLTRTLNTLLSPGDQFLAYRDAVETICPWIEGIYVAFADTEGNLADSIFVLDVGTSMLRAVSSQHEIAVVRKMIEVGCGRRAGEGWTTKHATRKGGVFVLKDLFLGGASVGMGAAQESGLQDMEEGPEAASHLMAALPLKTRSGTEGWVLFAGSEEAPDSVIERHGNILSVCTDILATSMERMSLFQKVLRAKKEWERSVDAIRDVVMIVDPEYTVQRGNRRLAEAAGVPVNVLKGMKCHRLLASCAHGCPSCPVGDTHRTLKEFTAEVYRPGRDEVFQVWSYPILNPSGVLESVAVYEKDITEIKEMQGQLLFSEKMAVLGRMAAAVAHEINNPLSGVISLSKIVLAEMDPGLPYVEDLKNIEQAALRCKKIVQDLLVFSRKPEAEAHDPVSLQSLMERVHGILRSHLEESGVRMEWTIPAGLPLLPHHPDSLQQILMNLVSNARDALCSGGRIRIRAKEEERKGRTYVLLTVEDSGKGMNADQLEKIFEPFYTTKGPGEGTGLGLSICQNLMESFGGSMDVSSTQGKGTVVSLWFPLRVKGASRKTLEKARGGC